MIILPSAFSDSGFDLNSGDFTIFRLKKMQNGLKNLLTSFSFLQLPRRFMDASLTGTTM
jgi:hypothetical protein